MLYLQGVALNNVLIDASLALTALLVGFGAATWYLKNTWGLNQGGQGDGTGEGEAEKQANDAARTSMAALQLRDLAKNVATDVGEHQNLMHDINHDLGTLNPKAPESGAVVVSAVSKILAANDQLHSRLQEAEQKIKTQAEEIRTQQSEARTDALTNLANRRAFDDLLIQNLDDFQNTKRPFCLLIFDVDHFKKFNDTHGHQAGDEVLRAVAKRFKEVVKHSDVCCRYGGEEFALVMANTGLAEARVAAERIRKAIETMQVGFEGKKLNVTASIGLAEVQAEDDVTKLVRRSDDAVYFSKEAGRNCGHWNDGHDCMTLQMGTNPKRDAERAAAESNAATAAKQEMPGEQTFCQELGRRIAESHRFGLPLSSMHIHVLNHASLENEYGDAVGELLLDSVAQFIRASLRDMDLLAQLSPGKFAVMLPGSSEQESRLVSQRIQTAISNCSIPLGGKQIKLQLAIGLSCVSPGDTVEMMMLRASEHAEANSQQLASLPH